MIIIKTDLVFRPAVLLILFLTVGWSNLFFRHLQEPEREEKIKLALQKAQFFLGSVQRENGAICDTANTLFDTWETILASTALYETLPDTGTLILKKAMRFLQQNENTGGLVCHNTKCKQSFCLETTAEYFSLLISMGKKEKVKQRLPIIINMQKESGEWDIGNPDVKEQKNFPSVTAFVLGIANEAGAEPLNKSHAYSWLINSQTADGHWGHAWEYYGCPAYALWPAMRALSMDDSPEAVTAKQRAIRYICSLQQKDGSWHFGNTTYGKQVSPELETALMLTALRYANFTGKDIFEKGIDFLLSNQSFNGSWPGGDFPVPDKRYVKKEYIMATSLTIRVIHNYLWTCQQSK